jgi:hypothetical protein
MIFLIIKYAYFMPNILVLYETWKTLASHFMPQMQIVHNFILLFLI